MTTHFTTAIDQGSRDCFRGSCNPMAAAGLRFSRRGRRRRSVAGIEGRSRDLYAARVAD